MLRRISLLAVVPVLVLLARPAKALDVDRIEVKSQLGRPLLAEIPVVSADPAELTQLQAQLASPATFARIGLERPRGAIADLQFKVVRNARGDSVIRVTTSMPVQQDFLTFLIQVDWSGGRLVREYSIALDGPDALYASASPLIQAPVAAPSNAIVKQPAPVAIPLATDDPGTALAKPPVAAPIPVIAPIPSPRPRVRIAGDVAKPHAERGSADVDDKTGATRPFWTKTAISPPPTAPAEPAVADGYGPVKSGDTLSRIAEKLIGEEYSRNQSMLALLRVNPEAFVDGNINLLKRGAILKTPRPAELVRFSATEAATMVRDQNNRWRDGRPTQPQPAALPLEPLPRSQAVAPIASRFAPARLKISPPVVENVPRSAPQSGIQAGGDGDALPRRSLPASAEASASLEAEILDLKARVEALDRLQREQRVLIALKEKELAAGRATNREMPWAWLLVGLVILPVWTWWFMRRRQLSPVKLVTSADAEMVAPESTDSAASNQKIDRENEVQFLQHLPAWHLSDELQSSERGEQGVKKWDLAG